MADLIDRTVLLEELDERIEDNRLISSESYYMLLAWKMEILQMPAYRQKVKVRRVNKTRVRTVSEAEEQEALFRWAEWAKAKCPELKLLFHVPNGGRRDKVTAARLKAQGVKPGVPDLFLPVARGGSHGLWIELKAQGGKASAAQGDWIADLNGQGYHAIICYGWESAKEAIEKYLDEREAKKMTNAEKIRNMTDEELTDAVFGERYCPPGLDYFDCNADTDCKKCRLQWLRKEE